MHILIKIDNGIIYFELSKSYYINHRTYNTIFDRINDLLIKKVVLQIVSIIILQESEMIHVILYL